MAKLDDSARFAPADLDSVVSASFACPLCLRRAAWLILTDDGYDAAARCRCMVCVAEWTVRLSSEQYLRVALAPPAGLLVLREPAVEGGASERAVPDLSE